jgi:flagellar FliJ protein
MTNHSALDTLIELATTASDEAARRLGAAIRASDDAAQKLNMLLQYRDDYQTRFHAGLTAGMTASGYRNFQLFMDKLDTAIAGQQQIVDNIKRKVEAERGLWQQSERKRMSYDTLATRFEHAAQQLENKRDQKMMDEFATRSAHNKRQ